MRAPGMRERLIAIAGALGLAAASLSGAPAAALVFLSDFGVKDGAVSAMKGVAHGVSPRVPLFDVTHEIPPYDIWQGAYRLAQAAPYWPVGTVFVTVVDPGVGTDRTAVVVRTKTGHYFVGPDNGLYTFIAERMGIDRVRKIDETRNRLKGSAASYTFHGRDVFAYAGARLAGGIIAFAGVGPEIAREVKRIPHEKPRAEGDGSLIGGVPILDIQYGNVWSDIPPALFKTLNPKPGDHFRVEIRHGEKPVFDGVLPYAKSFGDVPEGKPLLFLNSLLEVSVALNLGNFAETHKIVGGPEWSMRVSRAGGSGGNQ